MSIASSEDNYDVIIVENVSLYDQELVRIAAIFSVWADLKKSFICSSVFSIRLNEVEDMESTIMTSVVFLLCGAFLVAHGQ